MIRDHLHRENRSAFTLIELMVVIMIIAILVGLLSSAAFKALEQATVVRTATELSLMQDGLALFMTDYQLTDPPPSILSIHEDGVSYNPANPLDAATLRFFQTTFNRNFVTIQPRDWNGNGKIDPPYILQGAQCLVFYLGGIPAYTSNGSVGMTGFGTSSFAPDMPSEQNLLYPVASPNRRGPYFTFDNSRLTSPLLPVGPQAPAQDARFLLSPFPTYQDPWQAFKRNGLSQSQPYAYFSTGGTLNGYNPWFATLALTDNSLIGANAYYQGLNVVSGRPSYMAPNIYQIVSAGKDGFFGYDLVPTPMGSVSWSPAGGGAGTGLNSQQSIAGNDDQASFTGNVLGVGEQK